MLDLKPNSQFCLATLRDAAWPSSHPTSGLGCEPIRKAGGIST